MARIRRGDAVDGFVVIDKALGLTSTQVTGRTRRIFNAAKAGHVGTLDPLATGVLIVALGEGTKLVSHLVDQAKAYRFTVRWGEERESDDAEGAVTATSPVRPMRPAIEAIMPRFLGAVDQAPPAFSAVKMAGKPAYARARAGEDPKPMPRRVRIDRLALIDIPDPDHAVFEVACGKGMYVRSLARDMGRALGTHGHVSSLRRTAVGAWRAERAISLDSLDLLRHSGGHFAHLHPVETVLDDIPALALTDDQALRLRQGQAVRVARVEHGRSSPAIGSVAGATLDGRLVALIRVDGDCLTPLRVFHPSGQPAPPTSRSIPDVDHR